MTQQWEETNLLKLRALSIQKYTKKNLKHDTISMAKHTQNQKESISSWVNCLEKVAGKWGKKRNEESYGNINIARRQ